MKKINLVIFLLLSLFPKTHSQPYKSMFGSEGTSWNFVWYNMFGLAQDIAITTQDTFATGFWYKKIELVRPSGSESVYIGLLREDTIIGKVWFRNIQDEFVNDTTEYLAFDFSLEEGDSMDIIDNTIGIDISYPSVVDSVRYIEGLKYIYFSSRTAAYGNAIVSNEPYTFIEGIGGNTGPFWKAAGGAYLAHYLTCSFKNEEQTGYRNLRYGGDCFAPTSIFEKPSTPQDINIYPNPTSDEVNIKFIGKEKEASISLYDVTGRLLLKNEKIILGHNAYKISMKNLNAGIYFMSIEEKNRKSCQFKVIRK